MNFRTTAVAVVAAAAVQLASMTAMAETIRITLQFPENNPLGKNWNDFIKIVEKESNGELDLQLFPSAQLFKDKDVPQAVGTGAVEMGTASLTQYSGSVPAVDVFYIPFLFDTPEKVEKATNPDSELRKKIDEAVLKATGGRLLWWQAFGRSIYLTRGPEAIRVPADAKGKKFRTYGQLTGWIFEAVGAAPVLMSGSKQFLAYQQGAVDAGVTGLSGVKTRKLYEVMDHLTATFDSDIEFVAVINEEFFQSLSKEKQDILVNAGRTVERSLRDSVTQTEAETLEFLRDKIHVVELTDEERAKWREATKSVRERFAESAGPLGRELLRIADTY